MPPPPSLAVRPCVVKERRQHGACGVRTACWPTHMVKGCVIKTATHATFGHVFFASRVHGGSGRSRHLRPFRNSFGWASKSWLWKWKQLIAGGGARMSWMTLCAIKRGQENPVEVSNGLFSLLSSTFVWSSEHFSDLIGMDALAHTVWQRGRFVGSVTPLGDRNEAEYSGCLLMEHLISGLLLYSTHTPKQRWKNKMGDTYY